MSFEFSVLSFEFWFGVRESRVQQGPGPLVGAKLPPYDQGHNESRVHLRPGPPGMTEAGADPPTRGPRVWAIGGDGTGMAESRRYGGIGMPAFLRDLWTPQGLRPMVGDYALDPNQQQQATYWQAYQDAGNVNRIEDWLQVKPNAALIAEQWLGKGRQITPKKTYNTVNWLPAKIG